MFKELKLPAAFGQLRERLEKELGPRAGTRHYIRVLQLLGRCSVGQVAAAIDANLHRHGLRAEFIEQKLTAASAASASPLYTTFHLSEGSSIKLPTVVVPTPDLRRFDQLLIHRTGQGPCDHCNPTAEGKATAGEDHVRDVIEAQPQDAATADDAGRVCPALT
jgi:hypothetical protein